MACLIGACASPPTAPAQAPAVEASTEQEPAREEPDTPLAGAVWERGSITETTDGPPILVVENRFPLDQFVWLDDALLGTVPAGSERAFEIAPGAHLITCSDSATRPAHPSFVAEVFDIGYRYRYQVVAR